METEFGEKNFPKSIYLSWNGPLRGSTSFSALLMLKYTFTTVWGTSL
jgi:hypothetical protein